MDRWLGKVAVVTGASSGIGAAISKALVEHGLLVVGLARRAERIQRLAENLVDAPGKLYAVKCDVAKESNVLEAFRWIEENLGAVSVLVNNAGLIRDSTLIDGATSDWKNTFDVNVMALSVCTREAVKSMREHDVAGHVIHVNSVVGHQVPSLPFLNVYAASKFAVTALAETLRFELLLKKIAIKITSLSPGIVSSGFQGGLPTNNAGEHVMTGLAMLECEDVANAVVYVLGTPPHLQIKELTLKHIEEAF